MLVHPAMSDHLYLKDAERNTDLWALYAPSPLVPLGLLSSGTCNSLKLFSVCPLCKKSMYVNWMSGCICLAFQERNDLVNRRINALIQTML